MKNDLLLEDLKKKFGGVQALSRVSFSIRRGFVTGIIGPNGSGKSTLINLLTGFHDLDGGSVLLGRERLDALSPWIRSQMGLTRTFQEVRVWNQLSVLDNILVVLTERNCFASIFERHTTLHLDHALLLLERVGLKEKKSELAFNLSYGQRKLLEIARALAMPADFFFFDEPFAGLFPKMVEIVSLIIRELRDQGKAVVLVEHNMKLVRELCDYLIVLDSGEVLAEGVPREVLVRPDVIHAYLGT